MTVAKEDDEDDFVDAKEDLESEAGDTSGATAVGDFDGDGDRASVTDEGDQEDVEALEKANADAAAELEAAAQEEPDLFETTFGAKASQDSEEQNEDDEDLMEVDGEDFSNVQKTSPGKAPGSYRESLKSEHAKGCNPSRGPSTPSDSADGTPGPPAPPKAPDPVNDASRNLKHLKSLHNRAVQLIPRLPLAAHRYWIGVLNLDVNPKYFNTEKHFTWMKGNRFTTVETVWHTYQQVTASEGFVLLVGYERVQDKDRMEELDYFNDKKIVLRAVHGNRPEAKGRALCEGVVPVLEVAEGKKSNGSQEVIEIEDD